MTSQKFPAVTSREVVKVLESIGFQFARQSPEVAILFTKELVISEGPMFQYIQAR